MDLLKLSFSDHQSDHLKRLLELHEQDISLEIGSVNIPAGTQLPNKGESAFPRHEISIIIEGKIQIDSQGQSVILQSGDIVSIPAKQYSKTRALEPTKVIYIFFGK